MGNAAVSGDDPFIKKAKELGFRWGGDFSAQDPIHLDAGAAGSPVAGYPNRAAAIEENQKDFADNEDSLKSETWKFEPASQPAGQQ